MQTVITLFGRPMCSACTEAKEAIQQVSKYTAFQYHQVTGDVRVDGPAVLAEADFYDVIDVLPVVIIERGDKVLRRWEGVAPGVEEIREAVT